MKNLFLTLIVFMFSLSSCNQISTQSTIGDGKLDPIEKATIQLAVGIAMNEKPDSIIPAYMVTNELIALNNNTDNNVSTLEEYNLFVRKQIDSLDLDIKTKQSAIDLYILVKEIIIETLKSEGISEDQKYIVIMDIVKIINQSAKDRLQNVRSIKFDK
jgi:hypothetical protein